ncbi:hypothetical protein D3C86_2012730 [compost metagenome]
MIEKASFKTGDQGVHQLVLKVSSRGDFPSKTLRGYILKAGEASILVPDLNPGESREIAIPIRGFDKQIHITVIKPTGFITIQTDIDLK